MSINFLDSSLLLEIYFSTIFEARVRGSVDEISSKSSDKELALILFWFLSSKGGELSATILKEKTYINIHIRTSK